MLLHQRTGTPILLLESTHHRHQIVVANAFQIADTMGPRLIVGLTGDQIDQLVIEFRYVHQFGPWPFQRRTELRHEMLHTCFAARNAVGFKQAHLRPANAKAIADRVVNFLGRGDAILDQPQCLAPHCLKETVGHMSVDLLFQMQRVHPDRDQGFLGFFN